MTSKIKILALFGKSGSWKDTVQNLLLTHTEDTFHKIVSCTTRPIRENEAEGHDYHFISKELFTLKMWDEEFIEALEFNGWFYGALISALDPNKINIGIFTPEEIESLFSTASAYNLEILPVYVKCPDKTRLLRILNREQNPDVAEICRRFAADEKDFSEIDLDFYFSILNDSDRIDLVERIVTLLRDCKDFFD